VSTPTLKGARTVACVIKNMSRLLNGQAAVGGVAYLQQVGGPKAPNITSGLLRRLGQPTRELTPRLWTTGRAFVADRAVPRQLLQELAGLMDKLVSPD
jgi:hypothetical protein